MVSVSVEHADEECHSQSRTVEKKTWRHKDIIEEFHPNWEH